MTLNLLFMNTLEKKVGENRVISAQVVIGESKGIWHAMWSETKDTGYDEQENWYEGQHWNELITSLRANLIVKLTDGFLPLITVPWEEAGQGLGEKGRWNALLQCYSESNFNNDVMDALRKWRRDKAAKLAKAPYLIATNRMLEMIAALLPQNVDELKQLPGFGNEKVAQFGDEIFAITMTVDRATSFPLTWVERAVDPIILQKWIMEQRERKRKIEHDKLARKRRFLEAIWQGASLDSILKELSISRRDAILLVEEMDNEGYNVNPIVEAELEQVQDEMKTYAWELYEKQGDRYLKPIFQAIIEQGELSSSDSDRTYQWLRLLRIQFRRSKTAMLLKEADMQSQAS
ncbi:HRDC domain-containing protein [Paenibacillus albiflavus]|nr:HRDC domain-containing protein [Paenibacillus albiflavus]